MGRGEGAVGLKMGLSCRTHSLNPQKQSGRLWASWGYCAKWAHFIHLPHHSFPSISISSCLPPFISRWAYYSSLHACISASLKWSDLRTPFSFHSSERVSRVTLAFVEREPRHDQSFIDFVSSIYSKWAPLPIRKQQADVFLYNQNGTCKWSCLREGKKNKKTKNGWKNGENGCKRVCISSQICFVFSKENGKCCLCEIKITHFVQTLGL